MVVRVFDDGNDVRTVALSEDEDAQLERQSRCEQVPHRLVPRRGDLHAVGAVVATEPATHYFWGEVAVAILSILVLVLRGRSLPDRVHAVTFFVGAFVLLVGFTLTVITGTSTAVAEISVLGGVALVTVLATVAGMMLPGADQVADPLRRISIWSSRELRGGDAGVLDCRSL